MISEVLIAVLLGIAVGNVWTLPPAFAPGVRFALQRVLRAGIVLLGARLSLDAILAIGIGSLGLILVCMSFAFAVAILLGRSMGVEPRLALLIGVGTAVCGNSAIVAVAPVVRAQDREVSFAVGTITLFGTVAVFVFPLIGASLGLSDLAFGIWSGIAVNDTSQVVAASTAYSGPARDVATVVKLVRNTLMAPLIVGIAWWWQRHAEIGEGAARRGVLGAMPLFVLGFLVMAGLRTAGVIGADEAAAIDHIAKGLILIALAGVGLNTKIAQMRAIGAAPFTVGLVTATLLAALSLAAIIARGA